MLPANKAVKVVKKPRQSAVVDNRLASTSYDDDVVAGSENDDADDDELHDSREELDDSGRSGGITNRKRRGIVCSFIYSFIYLFVILGRNPAYSGPSAETLFRSSALAQGEEGTDWCMRVYA